VTNARIMPSLRYAGPAGSARAIIPSHSPRTPNYDNPNLKRIFSGPHLRRLGMICIGITGNLGPDKSDWPTEAEWEKKRAGFEPKNLSLGG
jgi:hypothetical protein